MSREEKESIVGWVSSIVSCFHMELEQHNLTNIHGAAVRDLAFADALFGIRELGLRAAVYIQPPFAGTSPIFIEVGKMKAGKWDDVLAPDDKPLTIIHIELDGSVHVIHPRNTRYENDLVLLLHDLWPLREELTTGNREAGTALHDRVIQVVENISRHVAEISANQQQAGPTISQVCQIQDAFVEFRDWLLAQDDSTQVSRALKVIEKALVRQVIFAGGRANLDQ